MADERISYRLREYDYDLPPSLIAQSPSSRREESRLLVLERGRGSMDHVRFRDLPDHLRAEDMLVVNDTRVVPARLIGFKDSGGRIELLVTEPYKSEAEGRRDGYWCLAAAAKRTRPGCMISLPDDTVAEVLEAGDGGRIRVRFLDDRPLMTLLSEIGAVPLPPYINRSGTGGFSGDAEAYQTVYARNPGAVAAPTAGLHFSPALLEAIARAGVEVVRITLHVGHGTFAPIRVDDIRDHEMHPEYVRVNEDSAERIRSAIDRKRRIVAVGTTVVRTLEWIAHRRGEIMPAEGACAHYIYPGYRFKVVGAMITNFHLPKSSLLLLVSAFAGRRRILEAYREAIRREYRFFSYGDAMLIL